MMEMMPPDAMCGMSDDMMAAALRMRWLVSD
ncbi:MAG: hypothetical protein CM15mP80_00030 [Alphaproteobacteria bacterium]|nr:MAG: hypothetical protein CM15mP80_00030 [Alphaproteobacteria bacterium]